MRIVLACSLVLWMNTIVPAVDRPATVRAPEPIAAERAAIPSSAASAAMVSATIASPTTAPAADFTTRRGLAAKVAARQPAVTPEDTAAPDHPPVAAPTRPAVTEFTAEPRTVDADGFPEEWKAMLRRTPDAGRLAAASPAPTPER